MDILPAVPTNDVAVVAIGNASLTVDD